jgi:NADH-quinone oxidoreductase subunit A
LPDYLPILIFLIFSICVVLFLFLLGLVLSPFDPSAAKVAPYECGFPAEESTRKPFDVRFYLIAILFIVFDVETALLFPWAVAFRSLTFVGALSMLMFLALLTVGYVYEWASGSLDWE